LILAPYISIAQSYVRLLAPLAEVVIHDVATNSICFIDGHLSNRKVGDPSFLDIDLKCLEQQIDQVVYPKINFDGKLIKSVSLPIKDDDCILAIMCFNVDVSVFSQMQQLAQAFLLPSTKQPETLFKNDWQEKVHQSLYQWLNEHHLKIESLSNAQKKRVVQEMYTQGAFHEKKAADYIASILGLSRASVFNYLKEIRRNYV
jgi:predicted transcriptional regulator YheO